MTTVGHYDPEDTLSLGEPLYLHQAVADDARAHKDGRLTLRFIDGTVINVEPDRHYEAFHVTLGIRATSNSSSSYPCLVVGSRPLSPSEQPLETACQSTAPRGDTSRAATPRPYSTTSRSPCLVRSTPESDVRVDTTCSVSSSSAAVPVSS
jgi:hypothetical protein